MIVFLAAPVQGAADPMDGESGLYHPLPEAVIHTTEGEFRLGELYDQSPLLLAPVFTRCAGICSPFLAALKGNLESLKDAAGFRVLVFSFDPMDTPKDLHNMARLFRLDDNPQWIFGTISEIEAVTKALQFKPEWDEETGQFEHEALLAGVNNRGYIVRKLTGLQSPTELGHLVKEIRGGFQPAYPLPNPGTLFTCFTYDPATGRSRPSLGLAIMGLPAFGAVLLVAGLSAAARRARNRA